MSCVLGEKKAKPLANSEDSDQMAHSAASELGLHCLRITFLEVSRLIWVIRTPDMHFGLSFITTNHLAYYFKYFSRILNEYDDLVRSQNFHNEMVFR